MAARADDGVFDPEGVSWTRVSPRLATVRRVGSAIGTLVPLVPAVLLAVLLDRWWILLLWLPFAAVGVLRQVVIGRQVAAIGYAERDDDLLVRQGLLFRTLVVVPYGRMQYVDVTAGPVDRWAGIATVQLHTASAGTDASIPGLPPAEAERLRDRLASRGEARMAGL
ncbi:PH domain-containing protein [uncultured Pseudokineococcus sp.]|uniref:PH domain-containing protein n=1 Tax=uncultured Pseudokineococcus sp. TaxID=1642928 RepID=UPI002625ADAB|nr:PH domain-containing protein [uncultured Pseudokineococcus sp.]